MNDVKMLDIIIQPDRPNRHGKLTYKVIYLIIYKNGFDETKPTLLRMGIFTSMNNVCNQCKTIISSGFYIPGLPAGKQICPYIEHLLYNTHF